MTLPSTPHCASIHGPRQAFRVRALPLRAWLGVGAALLACGGALAQSPPLEWQGRVGLGSAYTARGLVLGQGALGFANLDAYTPAGWSLGGGALLLRDTAAQLAQGWTWRLGYAPPTGDACRPFVHWRQDRFFHSDTLAGWGGTHGSLGWQCDDRWSLTLNHDRLRAKALSATSLDFSLQWPLAPGWHVNAGLGHAWLRDAPAYGYAQAGLAWQTGAWHWHLSRQGVLAAARPGYGPSAAPRWVASAVFRF
ncbi:MAG: hypothetical protein ACK5QH_04115 [Rubrivivax sp.]|jgi:hypothetical protein